MSSSPLDHGANSLRHLELALPVSSGPFNQISIPLKSIESAVYLAKGAYGWWKGPEKSRCLLDIIESKKGELSAALTFNPRTFKAREARYPLQGVSIGSLEPGRTGPITCTLPAGSTSMTGSEGLNCLRALTTGLLCLFDLEETSKILIEIVPDHLIRHELDDIRLEKQGPLSTALTQYVKTVSLEEDNRRSSQHLLALLDTHQKAVNNLSVEDLKHCQVYERPLVIAFLSWLLTSEYKREIRYVRVYPTRSLRVWSLAFLLGELAFEAVASSIAIKTEEMYRSYLRCQPDPAEFSHVFLITQSVGIADPTLVQERFQRAEDKRQRLIPIGTIPYVTFEHYALYKPSDGTEKPSLESLAEIFYFTFEHVQRYSVSFSTFDSLISKGDNKPNSGNLGNPFDSPAGGLTAYQKYKLQDWIEDTRVSDLLAKPIAKYLATDCPDRCGRSPCLYSPPFLPPEGSDNRPIREAMECEIQNRHRDMRPWMIMHIIMLSFAYAIASQILRLEDGCRANLNTEIIWRPIRFMDNVSESPNVRHTSSTPKLNTIIPDGNTVFWALAMSSLLGASPAIPHGMEVDESPVIRIKRALYQMMCGNPLLDIPNLSISNAVGCCMNGITLLSDVLVDLSVNRSSLYIHHLRFGRLLELPVNDHGLLVACSPRAFVDSRCLLPITRVLSSDHWQPNRWSIPEVRWDPEPDWERDDRQIGLRCRVDGIPRFIYNPWQLASRQFALDSYEQVTCSCTSEAACTIRPVVFPPQDFWMELSLKDFYRNSGPKVTNEFRTLINPGHRLFLVARAGCRGVDQLAALGLFNTRETHHDEVIYRKLLSPCLKCAIEPARRAPSHYRAKFRDQLYLKKHLILIVIAA